MGAKVIGVIALVLFFLFLAVLSLRNLPDGEIIGGWVIASLLVRVCFAFLGIVAVLAIKEAIK